MKKVTSRILMKIKEIFVPRKDKLIVFSSIFIILMGCALAINLCKPEIHHFQEFPPHQSCKTIRPLFENLAFKVISLPFSLVGWPVFGDPYDSILMIGTFLVFYYFISCIIIYTYQELKKRWLT
jgi:hypothetical protein